MATTPTAHRVRNGECLQSIAALYGFFPDTLWDHPDNAELASLRSHGSVLAEGDILNIPALSERSVSAPTDARAVFRRRAVPSILSICLHEEGNPESFEGLPWRVDFPGVPSRTGTVDSREAVATYVPPEVRSATVIIDPGGPQERTINLSLGTLGPADTREGAEARLQNLGYLDAPPTPGPVPDPAFRSALRWFQDDQSLELSGALDSATSKALIDAHGY